MSITLIGFIGVYCSALLATIFADASFGIFLYQFDYFVNPNRRWFAQDIPTLRYSLIIGITTLVAFLARMPQYTANRFFEVPPIKWWVVLGLLFVAVWPIALNEPAHQRFMELFLKTLAFGFLMYKVIDTPLKLERLIWVFLAGEFYLGYLAWQIGRNSGGRVEGLGPGDSPDTNGLSAVLVACVPLAVFYVLRGRLWQRFAALGVLAFVMNGAILASSRGAFLGMATGLAYVGLYMLASWSIPTRQKLQGCLGAVVVLGLFLYLADDSFWHRMATLLQVKVEEQQVKLGETTTRIEYWKGGIAMANDRPLGSGFYGFQALSHLYVPHSGKALHNSYVQALVVLGYPGAIAFGLLIVSMFRMMGKTRRHVQQDPYLYLQHVCFGGCFVSILTTGMFLDRFSAEIMYWMIVFLACFRNIYELKGCDKVESPFAHEAPKRVGPDHGPRPKRPPGPRDSHGQSPGPSRDDTPPPRPGPGRRPGPSTPAHETPGPVRRPGGHNPGAGSRRGPHPGAGLDPPRRKPGPAGR